MNEKQYYWIYSELKKVFKDVSGESVTDQTAKKVDAAVTYILDVTRNTRREDKAINEEIRNITRLVLLLVHSAEKVGRPL